MTRFSGPMTGVLPLELTVAVGQVGIEPTFPEETRFTVWLHDHAHLTLEFDHHRADDSTS